MSKPCFSVLLIADDPGCAPFVVRSLANAPREFGAFSADCVSGLQSAIESMARRPYDVVVLGLDSSSDLALEATRRLSTALAGTPVVVLTEFNDLDFAVKLLGVGVQDTVPRAGLSPAAMTRALRYAIARRHAQGQLQAALKEKEVLLHELHHRAKNNLQVISGLLNMQARRERDPRFREIVATAQQRIDAIALAHDKLHQAPDLSRIDFSAYLAALAHAVHVSYGGETRGIRIELSLGECELSLEHAVPTGILVNELLMNAFKHAFPDGRPGTVRVSASRADGLLQIEVADDGVGIPSGASNDPRHLGLEIVATLAEQLDATLHHESGAGTTFRLSFSCSDET